MGLSGGSKSTSGSAQKWAQPYAKAGAASVQDVFNQWHEESGGRPMSQIAMMLAYTVNH